MIQERLRQKEYLPVLQMNDGSKVTPETWQQRRQELLKALQRHSYGVTPPAPRRVWGTLGEEDPDIARVLEICRELNMEQMISRFPQGLLTNAGSGGMGLSGGECQKIGIARALYKDPKIYLLDEATSSLDKESEKIVAECIHKLRDSGRTIIMVSHKKESAIIADNVVQIDRTGSKW